VVSSVKGHTLLESADIGDDALAEIGLIMELRRGFPLAAYKDTCMKRRIAIRIRSNRCADAAAYCQLLRQNDHELDMLQKTLTIHVSHFFRNPSMFEKLRTDVMPAVFREAETGDRPVRLWSLGCASGEEPYSLAIVLMEGFADLLRRVPVIIDASDIDAEILQIARQGCYSEDRLKDVPGDIRQRYFTPSGTKMQLADNICTMVTFRQSDMLDVRSYSPCDLVLCRNTLIYFSRVEQEKILGGIAEILPTGGILVLGKSETLVGDVRKRFEPVCSTERMYSKK